jgi:hypothetical protein
MAKVYNTDPIKGLPSLVKDIENIFSEENFPDADGGWLDAARHFYGQAYATQKYGWGVARAAGIYNEYEGFFRQGQETAPVRADFINNREGRNYYFKKESAPYLKVIEDVINDPEKLTKGIKDSLMINAKDYTVYAPDATKIDNLSRWSRYNPGRIIKFLKEAY